MSDILTLEEVGTYLEHQGFTDDEIDDFFLEHFGVKGMKWGVRRQNRTSNLRKVAKGKSTTAEKYRAYRELGFTMPGRVARLARRGFSIKKAAAVRAPKLEALNERVRKGEGSALDVVKYYGGTKRQDLIPTKRSPNSAKAAVGASIAGAILFSYASKKISKLLSNKASG